MSKSPSPPESLLRALTNFLKQHADVNRAREMAKYTRDKFAYFGIGSVKIKEITLQWEKLKEVSGYLGTDPTQSTAAEIETRLFSLLSLLFSQQQREYCHVGLNILKKYEKYWGSGGARSLEQWRGMIKSNAKLLWWDLIDCIAGHVVGPAVAKIVATSTRPSTSSKNLSTTHPATVTEYPLASWLQKPTSPADIWLLRIVILHQMFYKEKTDEGRLIGDVEFVLGEVLRNKTPKKTFALTTSDIFFLQKAIGWALRNYSYINPAKVRSYVSGNTGGKGWKFSRLIEREALKVIERRKAEKKPTPAVKNKPPSGIGMKMAVKMAMKTVKKSAMKTKVAKKSTSAKRSVGKPGRKGT